MSFIKNIIKRIREKWHNDILYPEQQILELLQKQQKEFAEELKLLKRSFIDPDGPSMIALRMKNLGVLNKYEHCFYEMPENSVCIDCGANQGFFTDLILSLHGICYSFEPNKTLYNLLVRKYRGNENVQIYPQAVAASKGIVDFKLSDHLNNAYLDFTAGGSISVDHYDSSSIAPEIYYQVQKIRLADFLQNEVFAKHDEIYILKMDIEGAEFETLEDIILSGVYKKIKYLFCETHARFFNDGDERLHKLETLIQDNNITNIFLDWV